MRFLVFYTSLQKYSLLISQLWNYLQILTSVTIEWPHLVQRKSHEFADHKKPRFVIKGSRRNPDNVRARYTRNDAARANEESGRIFRALRHYSFRVRPRPTKKWENDESRDHFLPPQNPKNPDRFRTFFASYDTWNRDNWYFPNWTGSMSTGARLFIWIYYWLKICVINR